MLRQSVECEKLRLSVELERLRLAIVNMLIC